jgi:hypothetical protein
MNTTTSSNRTLCIIRATTTIAGGGNDASGVLTTNGASSGAGGHGTRTPDMLSTSTTTPAYVPTLMAKTITTPTGNPIWAASTRARSHAPSPHTTCAQRNVLPWRSVLSGLPGMHAYTGPRPLAPGKARQYKKMWMTPNEEGSALIGTASNPRRCATGYRSCFLPSPTGGLRTVQQNRPVVGG